MGLVDVPEGVAVPFTGLLQLVTGGRALLEVVAVALGAGSSTLGCTSTVGATGGDLPEPLVVALTDGGTCKLGDETAVAVAVVNPPSRGSCSPPRQSRSTMTVTIITAADAPAITIG